MSRSSLIVRLLASCLVLAGPLSLGAATYTSSQNGNWSASSTWGGAGVPGAADTANVGHTVTLDVPVTVTTLTLTGTITGAQPISVTSAFNWNGGTQSGSGTTTIPSGSVMTLNGYGTLDGRPLSVAGSLNMTSSYYFYIQNNASIANSGTIDFQGDGGIYVSGAAGTIAITSSGTIKKSGGTFTSTLAVPLIAQNGSQFLVQSGTFNIAAVTSSGATFSLSGGTTVNFNTADTRTFDATSAISGAGTVQWSAGTNSVNGTYNITGATNNYGATTTIASPTSTGAVSVNSGTLTLNGAGTLSIPTLTISGGTLTGSTPITLTSTPMTWSGGIISGSGLLTIPAATTVTATGIFLDGRAVSNGGTIALSAGYLYMQNNATLTNSGTIDFTGDGNIYMNGTVGSTAVTNSGTIRKSGGASGSTLNVPLTMQSGSQLLAQSSILYLGPVTATGATVSVSSGATIYVYYGSASSFDATSSISGAGNVQWASGTNTVNANYNITGVTNCTGGTTTLNNISSTGALAVGGGTLTLNSGSTLTVPTLTMTGGILNGSAPISVTAAAMNWSSGTIGGSGLLSIPVGTTISLSGIVLDGRQLSNAGTINIISNGAFYFQNNATLTNSGTLDLQSDGNVLLNSAVGSIAITNSGTIRKSAGTTTSNINLPLVLQSGSQFLVQSAATFYLDAVTATGATIGVSSGATIYFYYNAVRSFDAATTISGAGSIQWGSGTNTVSATYNISGTTFSSGGTTTLSNITGLGAVNASGGALTLNGIPGIGSVTVNGGTLTLNNGSTLTFPTLTMGGGILNGTAPISVTAAAMTWSGGTIGGSGLVSVPVGTTVTLSGLILDGRQLSNAGTINIVSNGTFYMENNATVTNNGTIDLQSDGNVYLNSVLGSIAITNNGTLRKSAGTGSSTINVPIVLSSGSQFLLQAATLYLDAVTATSATISVSSGATLYFYYNAVRSFDAATTISGAGSVQWGSGTNTVNATYNISGTTYSSGGTTTLNTITGIGVVNVTGGALTLNAVPAIGSVTVGGGTLTLNSGSALTFPSLTMTGGTLNGTAPINLTAPSMTWSSGTIGGSGTLTIPVGTTITLTYLILDARPVTNAGTMNMVSGGYMYLQNNAVLTNNGTLDLQGDSSVYLNSVAGTTAVVNNGTIKKSAGTSGSTFNVALTAQNGSQFLVQSSIVYIDAVTSTGAAFNVSSGATLAFYYGGNRTFDATSTIGGSGTTTMQGGTATINGTLSTPLNVSGGTLTINSAATQTIPTLTISGGTLNGSGNINLTGAAMTWTGGIIGGSGTLTIPVGTVITLSGYPYFDGRPITNNGTINFTSTNYVYLQNNAVLTNNGTVDLQNDAAIYLSGVAGSTAVVNNGTIKKSGGSGTSYLLVPLTAQSSSQFLIQTGTVGIGAVTATGATFNAASGTTLYFYTSDIRTFDAASPLSGSGTLLAQAGTNTVSGTLSLRTTLSGGTLTVNSASTQTLPSLALTGGTLNGTGAVTVSGTPMTWTGGTIGGSGVFTIASGTTVNVTGTPFFDSRPISNNGTLNLTTTNYIYMMNNAVLTNNGTLDLQSDGNVYLNSVLGTTAIVNNGLFRKSGGINTSYIGIPVTNNAAATLQASSGTLQLAGGLTTTGVLSFVAASATLFGKMVVTGPLPFAGTLAATTTGGYTPPNGTTFQVLTYGSTSGAFSQKNLTYPSGQFTDSATSTALTLTAGPATCQTTPSGVVSWWRGEGNAVDSIGVNNGTLTGGATTAIGYVSSALTFNGTSAYVTVPDSASLHLTSLSIEGWVKFTTVSAAMFLSKPVGGGTANSYQLYYDGAGHLVAEIGDGAGANAKSLGVWTPTTGLWQHVAMTFDGPTQALTIYLDGAQIGNATTGKTPVYDASALLIGAEGDPGLTAFFAGAIDELTLYNRALTGAEVTSIFNSGNAGKCFSVSAPTISGFTPSNGPVGTTVTITGTNLIGTSAVSFNGTPASYTVNSATQVTAVVASGSTTGTISLTTAGGTAVSATSFTVGLPPADVSPSFASVPSSATAGTPFSATLGATNAGPNPATSVTYSVTVTGGTINSITPSVLWTSCTNSATSINCSATSLAASTTAPVGVNVTAPSAGTLTFSATTGAANDTNAVNDSGSASVNVIPACTTPPAAITAPATACPNATALAASVAVTAGATYAWTISNGVINSGQGTNSITFTAGASGNVILGVTVTNGTCTNSGNKSVPIATPAIPTITPSGSVTICTGNNVTLTANATGATSYAWLKNGNPLGVTTPTLSVNAAGSYTVTASYGSCSATSAPTTVTVTAPPSPAITAPGNLCAGTSGNASTPLIAGATYTWSILNGTITTGQSTNAITFTAGNSGSVTLSVTVTDASNCSGSANANVTINAAPSAAITAPVLACANTTVTASVPSQAGATYTWALAGVPIASGQGTSSITFTAPSSGNVAIDVTVAGGGCSSHGSALVSAAPSSLTVNAPPSVAAGSANNVATATTIAGATYAWTITNGTITNGQGTSTISFTAGNSGSVSLHATATVSSCSATGTASVAINALSADLGVTMTAAPSPVTPGAPVTFTVTVTNHGPGDASNVTVTTALPAPASSVNPSSAAFTCSGTTTVTCSAPSFANGATATISISVNAPLTGTSLNATATVSASSADANTANNSASAGVTIGQTTCGTTPAALLAPADGATTSSPVTFSWSAVDNATAYEVWTSADGAPASLASTSNSTSLTAAVSGNTVDWYVAARFDNGCPTLLSAHRSFHVTAGTSCQSHTAPLLTSPLGGSLASPVTFSWQGSPDAVGYEVWITVDGAAAQDVGMTSGATTLTAAVPPGNIGWFVDALFAGCPLLRSGTATFNVAKPDPCAGRAAAQLLAPADNSTHTSSGVDFLWTAVANTSGYRVWAAVDGAPFAALGTTNDTSLHAVIPAGGVEWYVEALFNGCASAESQHRTFVIPHAPNCGSNAQPANLAPQTDTANPSVTFSWTAVPNATGYEVWLALGSGSPTLLGSTTSTSLTHDVPAGALEWFVRAHFDGCPNTESLHAHFAYVPAVQCSDARPLLVAPLNGMTGVFAPVSFSWKSVAGATSYKLWLSIDEGAYTAFATTPAAHLDDAAVPNGTIDWYVEALTNGCPSTASTPSRFTVVAKPSGCPALTPPILIAPGAASSGVQYTVRWQRVAGATSYVVESAGDLAFSAPSFVSTDDDHYDFTSANDGSNPRSIFFRVRALATCQAQPGPYSTAVAVVILPSHTATNNLQGAISADTAQPITYTIPLDASLAGLAFVATPNQSFLTVTPSSGIVPAGGTNLTVTADTSHLAIGTTLGGITITTSTPSSSGHLTANGASSGTTTISISLVSPAQPTPKSTPPPDALIIPAVAHAGGINSTFQSDVRVTNSSPQVMKYQVTFTPTGDSGITDGKQTTIDINPGNTIALDDILGTWFNNTSGSAIGTLEIRPLTTSTSTSTSASVTAAGLNALATFASSRTFNVTTNGTFGQYIPAIPFSRFIGLSKDPKVPSVLSLQQIAQSSAFRTNLGIVEGSGQAASVLISVFGGNGSKVAEFPLDLAGGQHTQFSLASKNISNLTDGRVEVKVLTPGGKVTAYASVLDNLTSDPLLVSPVNLSAAGSNTYVVPGVANLSTGFANWRTDLRLFNATSSAVDATLTYYSQGGGDPKSVTVSLAPNEVKALDDTLANTFGVTNDGGAVHITTATATNLIATARTYNQTGNGTFGQFIPAVTPQDAIGVGSRPLQVLQLEESDRYRSNVGIAEVTGKPATVLLSVVLPDSKVSGNVQLDLAPNEFRQFNSLLKSFGTGTLYNARVAIKVISGEGRVTAYASVIDALTQDPTFVPAQ